MSKILLVDDDHELVNMLQEYLTQEGYMVTVASDGLTGVDEALSDQYALAVLDVMMPNLNGVDALKKIRLHSRMPIIMLTARGDDMDKIIGLELGADDYVPKPCTPRELLARIRSILRRTESTEVENKPECVSIPPLTLWPEKRLALWDEKSLDLTSTEFNLLEMLARSAGKPVSKQDLSLSALGRPLARYDRSIDVHLSSIRQKIGLLPDGRSYIQTVYRQGYQYLRE